MKKKSGKSKSTRTSSPSASNVVSLTDVRAKRSNEERRKVERFFLKDVVQIFCVIGPETEELLPVEIDEASETGFSFRIPHEFREQIDPRDDLRLRIYMSQDTYLYLSAEIMSAVPMANRGRKFMRYGCKLDTSFASYAAYRQLIQFIEAFALVSAKSGKKASGQ